MSQGLYTPTDIQVLQNAADLNTGGMTAFTSYWFSHEGYEQRWDLVATPPDTWKLAPNQEVPWVPLDWSMVIPHGKYTDYTIVGGWGCGKTLGIGAIGVYYSIMLPNFKFMDTAPTAWQAKQMYDAIVDDLFDWPNREENPKRIVRLVEKVVQKPNPKIVFKNGSTMEFLSAAEEGARIRSWSGDMAVIDEASLIDNGFDELIGNLGSRLRGQINGRVRLGKMVVMANADYNPEFWALYDQAEVSPETCASFIITSYDNPYLTAKQLAAMKRRAGDEDKFRTLMMSERPLPKGREFTPNLIKKAQDEAWDNIMADALEQGLEGFNMLEEHKAGCTLWERPYNKMQRNIILGDPGQSNPPDRNSAAIFVVDVSGLPEHPAELVAFNWVHGNGSYWPFIYKMEEYYDRYHAEYAGFDSTGTQKAFDELVFTQRGPHRLFDGVDFASKKMSMVLALKLLMGRGLISFPKQLKSLWLQLAAWHMPDTKLRQDIASAMFMVGWTIHNLIAYDQNAQDDDSEEITLEEYDRNSVNRVLNTHRGTPMRA